MANRSTRLGGMSKKKQKRARASSTRIERVEGRVTRHGMKSKGVGKRAKAA